MIELTIDNRVVDLNDNTTLTFNKQLQSPSTIESLSGEYSFTFNLPMTPNNNQIFNFANDIASINKFKRTYNVDINVDYVQTFKGTLQINSIDEDGYGCNVYVYKLQSLDDLFEDSTMAAIKWEVDYKQDETINAENAKEQPPIIYPLVSYGQFQKLSDENGNYTSIWNIDSTNKLYNENFLPSPNLIQTLKKCFELTNYEVDGDIFYDNIIKNMYLSTNIDDKQDLIYPYGLRGSKSMGYVNVKGHFNNYVGTNAENLERAQCITKELTDKLFPIGDEINRQYNFTSYNTYNVFNIISNEDNLRFGSVEEVTPDGKDATSMWRLNRIVIPSDGFYKIKFSIKNAKVQSPLGASQLPIQQWVNDGSVHLQNKTIFINSDNMFFELHLLRNTDVAEYEKSIAPHYCLDNVVNKGQDYKQFSIYPHELEPTLTPSSDIFEYSGGYSPQRNKTIAYDPRVSNDFICGVTKTNVYNHPSVMKNGYSWDKGCTDVPKVRTNVDGYYGIKQSGPNYSPNGEYMDKYTELTDYNKNTLKNGNPNTLDESNLSFNTEIGAIMYLEKNDFLQLHMIARKYDYPYYSGDPTYDVMMNDIPIEFDFDISVEAFSKKNVDIENDTILDWNITTHFPSKLQVNTFFNEKTKIKDFIQNVVDLFNLSMTQNGNTIYLNKQVSAIDKPYIVPITNYSKFTYDRLEVPKSMQVKFTTDEDEYGFVNSVPTEHIDDYNWQSYADIGSERVDIGGDAERLEKTRKFSYSWYKQFTVVRIVNGANIRRTIRIPIIAKDEWMIDKWNMDENMKEDGMGLTQRLWFKGTIDQLTSYGLYDINSKLQIKHLSLSNVYDGFSLDLKYDTTNDNILNKFYNFIRTNGDTIKINCRISANDYMLIANGAHILFEDNEFQPISVEYSTDGEAVIEAVYLI